MRREIVRRNLRLLLPSALLSIFLYILLHEFGHVIVLWSVDADITEFSIVSAHVNYMGGQWTDVSDRWMHLNGALFPFIIAALYMLLYRRDMGSPFYRIFSAFFVLMPICSLLAWVVIPFLYLQGEAPANDDVTKFLYNFTHYHPAYWVSIAAVLAIVASLSLALWKGIIQNLVSELRKAKDSRH